MAALPLLLGGGEIKKKGFFFLHILVHLSLITILVCVYFSDQSLKVEKDD